MSLESINRTPKLKSTHHQQRWERKYYVPAPKIAFAAHLLKHCCLPDKQYPKGTVHSVYYDTPDLQWFHASNEGRRNRKKIRIRWYDQPLQPPSQTTVFIELKSKSGFFGIKQRKDHKVDAQRFYWSGLQHGLISPATLSWILAEFDYVPNDPLMPMLLVSYQRLRFTDIQTGMRVSLDWNIRSRLVSPQCNRPCGLLPMSGGVIEIKGPCPEIPWALQTIRLLETDWSRYSKYAECMEAHLETSRSPGHTLPSGRLERNPHFFITGE